MLLLISTDPETPPTSRKRYLKEIRMKSSFDGDYSSVPSTPGYAHVGAGALGSPVQVVSVKNQLSQQGQLFQIIDALRKRVDANTPPQDEDDKEIRDSDKKTVGNSSSVHSSPSKSLGRSISYCSYTPPVVIKALHKRDGTYHKLNVENLWDFQQQHRYAPVSIILRNKGRKGMKGKRIKSLMSRGSMANEDLSPLDEIRRASDYEVPVTLLESSHTHNEEQPHPSHEAACKISSSPITVINPSTIPISTIAPSSINTTVPIPPPAVIRTSQTIARQKAIEHEFYNNDVAGFETPPPRKLSILSSFSTSEPCLSSFDDDDYDRLSPIKAPPPLPPKYSLGRAKTAPTLRPYLLYGKKDSDDYDLPLSDSVV